ncbi:mammalian ependymin-related protein 1-like [Mya arenaria]|uniref:mammalian ependymin-related protein 1-like n=1 Tax=Mya arenaria TaxID=6604 RepID=UPI0022E96D40|nr:mammalian ependymin-related protein 1-like [Mya arenaria]
MDKLFVLLILTPAVLGVKNCCFPSQFECVEGLVTGSADDEGHTSVTTGNLQLSYDASGRRIYVLEQLQTGNITETYTLIQLYNENMQYIIHNGTCTGGKLGSWDNRNCIPDNATAGTNFILGHQQSALVTPYMWNLADGTSLTMTVTDNCTPLSELTYGTREGTSFLSGVDFNNINLGIKDPTVFVVPDICKQQALGQTIYRRRRSHLY